MELTPRIIALMLPEDQRRYTNGQQGSASHRSAVSAANMEQAARLSSVAKKENPRLDPSRRVCLHIISRRRRLCDPDGISAKALIDGIVMLGVCENDSTKEIECVTFSQVKVSKHEDEQTIVEIKYAEENM